MSKENAKDGGDPRPRLYILSSQSEALVETLGPAISSWYSGIHQAREIEDLSAPEDGSPLSPPVVLADFRAGDDNAFEEDGLLDLGRIQARLSHAIVVLISPALSVRVERLVQQAGVNHLHTEPVNWEDLTSLLREIARSLIEREGTAKSTRSALLEVCQAMASTLELEPLLNKILGLIMTDLAVAQGSILLFDRDTDRLTMLASRGLPEEIVKKGYIPRKGSIAEWVIDNDQPLLLGDMVEDKRFSSFGGRSQIVSSICVPLRAKGTVQGTINLSRQEPAAKFSDEDLETAVILASQAAISIENARLYQSNLQAERLATIGQTVAGVAHSMRSIVTSLRGGISICEQAREMREWELLDRGWELVRRNFERMSSMALEMLDYSKSHRDPVRSEFELEPIILEIFGTASNRAGKKNIVMTHSIAEDAQTLFADQDQIFRAMLNIVENAIDALADEGKVDVTVRRVEGRSDEHIPISLGEATAAIFLEIVDNGPGIPRENQQRIFQPFVSTKGSKGTGLGLAVTNKLILEHGGKILLESEPDEGARFTIVLPALDAVPETG